MSFKTYVVWEMYVGTFPTYISCATYVDWEMYVGVETTYISWTTYVETEMCPCGSEAKPA
jgi:hypothetical protein